ncbi:MAG: exodeoxyribonuclease VII large subunit [Oscillospiraceae bacterium]|nr:exodeoxyribonuclease VII large subunit [Oscillospiraceae bacterium]
MDKVLSVTSLNCYVKSLLEEDYNLADIAVEGEISNFVNHYKSGHYYLALKDEKSLIKTVMFQTYNRKLSFVPQNGMKVIVRGKVSLYERDGTYQLYATDMFQSGMGLQHLAFERLKEKLFKEGLFDEQHKKQIPAYPFTVGVATSATGAALQDIISVTSRRFPCAKLVVAPCGVQGDNAKNSIISAIKKLDSMDEIEAIIIARGGGSKEDMWVFNDEDIARCAYACKKPTVSAVGHEIDWTILDYVCDKRAATPTAAAEIVFPDVNTIQYKLMKYDENISKNVKDKIDVYTNRLEYIKNSKGFNNIKVLYQKNTDLLLNYQKSFRQLLKLKLEKNIQTLNYLSDSIDNNNPLQNLKKGYALIFKDESPIGADDKLSKNDKIVIRTDKQAVSCTVDSVKAIRQKGKI